MTTLKKLLLILLAFASLNAKAQKLQSVLSQTHSSLIGVKFYQNQQAQAQVQNQIYLYPLNSTLAVAAVITTTRDLMCADCNTFLSVFVYRKNNDKWQLVYKKLKLAVVGRYGNGPEKDELKFTTLGQNAFVMYYEVGNVENNVSKAYLETYYFDGKQLHLTGKILIGEDNENAVSKNEDLSVWESEYTVDNSGKLPKIILHITGQKGNNQYNKTITYILNPTKWQFEKL